MNQFFTLRMWLLYKNKYKLYWNLDIPLISRYPTHFSISYSFVDNYIIMKNKDAYHMLCVVCNVRGV